MSAVLAESNPTGVSSFTGLSDVQKGESHFEALWEKGAFNPDGLPDPAQGQAAPDPSPAAAAPDAQAPVAADPAAPADAVSAPAADEPDYANLEDYLQKAGIERDSFMSLPVRVKVDGREVDAPLAELVKSYGLEKHFQAKSVAFAEQQKAWETERAQRQQAFDAHLKQAQALGQLAHQTLLAEYNGVDWNRLRAEDPSRWAVANQEFNNRATAIQQHLNQVQQLEQQRELERQSQMRETLPKERERMYEARPEWRDDKKFDAAKQEMTSYAQSRGINPAELYSVFDHRYLLILHDAAQFAKHQAQVPQAVKRVRTAPVTASPGARSERDPKVAAQTQLKEAFRKNPRDQDTAARYFGTLA